MLSRIGEHDVLFLGVVMKLNRVRVAFIGSGGDGVMSVANMFMRASADQGLYGLMAQSYGPQIRGGEAAAYVNVSDKKVYSENYKKDMIFCYSFAHAERFKKEFTYSDFAVLFYEEADKTPVPEWIKSKVKSIIPVPFKDMLAKEGLPPIAKNIVTLGMMGRLLSWELSRTTKFVEQAFAKKGPAIVESNVKAFRLGDEYGKKVKIPYEFDFKPSGVALRTAAGNATCAEAAMKAGCRFFAGYPITPSSEVLETCIKLFPAVNGKVIQAEDEMASMGMVIGASYGGIPAMTATSGPGLSLMTEMIGLASIRDIPCVIVNAQRGGPSTGIPSKMEQSDLFHSVWGGHGDFPRIALAPTDVEDCYKTMFRAFYLAEKFKLPVIVLSDGYIGQRAENIPAKIDMSKFPKITRTADLSMPQDPEKISKLYAGIEREMLPGDPKSASNPTRHVAGIEQDEAGRPSANREVHEKMNEKRFAKIPLIEKDTKEWFEVLGDPNSKIGFVAWGSTKGAMAQLLEERNNFKLFVPNIISPFPKEAFEKFVKGIDKLCFVELNFGGQLYNYVKTVTDLPKNTYSMALGGGTPMTPLEIETRLHETPMKEVVK